MKNKVGGISQGIRILGRRYFFFFFWHFSVAPYLLATACMFLGLKLQFANPKALANVTVRPSVMDTVIIIITLNKSVQE